MHGRKNVKTYELRTENKETMPQSPPILPGWFEKNNNLVLLATASRYKSALPTMQCEQTSHAILNVASHYFKALLPFPASIFGQLEISSP